MSRNRDIFYKKCFHTLQDHKMKVLFLNYLLNLIIAIDIFNNPIITEIFVVEEKRSYKWLHYSWRMLLRA